MKHFWIAGLVILVVSCATQRDTYRESIYKESTRETTVVNNDSLFIFRDSNSNYFYPYRFPETPTRETSGDKNTEQKEISQPSFQSETRTARLWIRVDSDGKVISNTIFDAGLGDMDLIGIDKQSKETNIYARTENGDVWVFPIKTGRTGAFIVEGHPYK